MGRIIEGFTATVKQLTATCDAATKALTDAKDSLAQAERAVKSAAAK